MAAFDGTTYAKGTSVTIARSAWESGTIVAVGSNGWYVVEARGAGRIANVTVHHSDLTVAEGTLAERADDLMTATRRYETARDQWARVSQRWASVALMGNSDPEGLTADALAADVRATRANTDTMRSAMRSAMADAGVGYRISGQPPTSTAGAHV